MTLSRLNRETMAVTPEVARLVTEVQEMVRQLSDELRTTSYLLHPTLLEENGLAAALRWYVDGLQKRSHLDVTLNVS